KYELVGAGELRADRSRQPEPHRPESTRVEPQARFVEPDELYAPHLMLADVGRDNGLSLRHPIDFGHEVLRLNFGVALDGLKRMLVFPSADLLPPCTAGGRALFILRGRMLAQLLVDSPEHALHVAHDRHVRRADLADFGGIDI